MKNKARAAGEGYAKMFGSHRIYLLRTDSTNEYMKRILRDREVEFGTVVCTVQQSKGRGRAGRLWESPPGGLWFSILLRQEMPLQQTAFLSLVFAVAVSRAINCFTHLACQVKWPNDIYLDRRKLAGILLETAGDPEDGKLIVGIGINVNTDMDDVSLETGKRAVSMEEFVDTPLQIDDVLEAVLYQMERYYFRYIKEGGDTILSEFKKICLHLGQKVQVNLATGSISGICIDIEPQGSLVLDTGNGIKKVHTGDVNIL